MEFMPDYVAEAASRRAEEGAASEGGEGRSFLPRGSPLVGFLRHAPQQKLHGQFDQLLCRRTLPKEALRERRVATDQDDAMSDASKQLELPRASPYVGFQRHAPPSPTLAFSSASASPLMLTIPELEMPEDFALDEELDEDETEDETLDETEDETLDETEDEPLDEPLMEQLSRCFPEAMWSLIFCDVIEVPMLCCLSSLARGFPSIVKSEDTWRGRPVRISPMVLPHIAPRLSHWLPAWRSASKLIVPRSAQLLREVARRAPDMPVEVAWRFDTHLKGEGVEVLNNGTIVRHIEEEELVVLGDAALARSPGRPAYLEVRIDERGEEGGDGLNDFGFGVTACDPCELQELGSVADEVPHSWVVDFTQNSVVLSINNIEAAKGHHISAAELCEGNRVGLRVMSNMLEVYINGVLREWLTLPDPDGCVPEGADLFPVVDLFGPTVQISLMEVDEPLP